MIVRETLLDACRRSEELRSQARVTVVALRQLAQLPLVPDQIEDVVEQLQDVVTTISQVCETLEDAAIRQGEEPQGRR